MILSSFTFSLKSLKGLTKKTKTIKQAKPKNMLETDHKTTKKQTCALQLANLTKANTLVLYCPKIILTSYTLMSAVAITYCRESMYRHNIFVYHHHKKHGSMHILFN